MKVNLRINGVSRTADVEPRTTLLDALRDNFLLNGTHAGCEHGVCGRSEEHTSELQSLPTISYAVSLIGRAHV